MKENLTVSDSKTLFHDQFPYVIPGLYKRIVDEMLVELNLLNHQSEFTLDSYFCVGLTEIFNELTDGYEPNEHLKKLFSALCKSTNFKDDEIIQISNTTIDEHKNKNLEEISNLVIEKISKKPYYSRILMLGIYKILSKANDFKDNEDITKIKIISELTEKLELPLTRAEKDISIYKNSITRITQAKELLKETVLADRKKREDKNKKNWLFFNSSFIFPRDKRDIYNCYSYENQ